MAPVRRGLVARRSSIAGALRRRLHPRPGIEALSVGAGDANDTNEPPCLLCVRTRRSCPFQAVHPISERAWAAQAKGGTLPNCWRTEIGTHGRGVILRGFVAPEAMAAERWCTLMNATPFRTGDDHCMALTTDSDASVPFLPPGRGTAWPRFAPMFRPHHGQTGAPSNPAVSGRPQMRLAFCTA